MLEYISAAVVTKLTDVCSSI